MRPKISFVMAARDPRYGGNLLHNFQVNLNALLYLAEKHHLSCEIIIVEWNPPSPEEAFHRLLKWGTLPNSVTLRFIVVPPSIHRKFPNSDRMPIFEYIAKNVGIRRAEGEYVLATNPDLLYSDELIAWLASRKLSQDCFYRIDRRDVGLMVSSALSVQKQLEFCSKNVVKVHSVDGSYVPTVKNELRRLLRKWERGLRIFARKLRGGRIAEPVHTNAAGDFFLMARDHWFFLRGYPELTTHMYIDGYICYMALSIGLKQKILKGRLRLYHQPHDRSLHKELPKTDYQLYIHHCIEMVRTGKPIVLNSDSWGLGDQNLTEHRFGL